MVQDVICQQSTNCFLQIEVLINLTTIFIIARTGKLDTGNVNFSCWISAIYSGFHGVGTDNIVSAFPE
jgi:hypothetical protein